jgi:hypothetical protein
MTGSVLHGGFELSEMYDLVERACAAAGMDPREAEMLRGQTNAVVRLRQDPVVIKIARKGTPLPAVARTVDLVRWLMAQGFPTVPLHAGINQPAVIDGHPVTFWTYLPQDAAAPITAADLAAPLHALHRLPASPVAVPAIDNLAAVRAALAATHTLPDDDLRFLSTRAEQLEKAQRKVSYVHHPTLIQGDPQHGNALRDSRSQRTVLCDWDTVAHGQPEWDLVTVEIHCRRFGYSPQHYQEFAATYGFDVTQWPGYPILRDIRELRMITTNAYKAAHRPGTLTEVRRRIAALRQGDASLRWSIL